MNVFTVLAMVFAAAGYLMGKARGRTGLGVTLGLFLGPIGLIVLSQLSVAAPASAPSHQTPNGLPEWGPPR